MKYFILTIVVFCLIDTSIAQDPHYSNTNFNEIYYNPSQAGLSHDLRIGLSYRNQWNAFTSPYQTSSAAIDFNTSKDPTKSFNLGLGFQFLKDNAGESNLGITQGTVNLSGIFKIDRFSRFSIGLMTGYAQRSIKNRTTWDSQYIDGYYNPLSATNESFDRAGYNYIDAGAGFTWSYGTNDSYMKSNDGIKANIGFSAFHFGLGNASFYESGNDKLRTKFVGHARVEVGKKNSNTTVIPSIYWSRQGKLNELLIGSDFRFLLKEASHFTSFVQTYSLTFGTHYRVKDALIAAVQFNYGQFAIRCSYDINVSKLSQATKGRGGFEIGLRFTTHNPFGSKGYRSKIN